MYKVLFFSTYSPRDQHISDRDRDITSANVPSASFVSSGTMNAIRQNIRDIENNVNPAILYNRINGKPSRDVHKKINNANNMIKHMTADTPSIDVMKATSVINLSRLVDIFKQ